MTLEEHLTLESHFIHELLLLILQRQTCKEATEEDQAWLDQLRARNKAITSRGARRPHYLTEAVFREWNAFRVGE